MRKEKDALGEVEVPEERYFGAQTARSLKHFAIGYHTMPTELIDAFLLIKRSAARVNQALGLLDVKRATLIVEAIDRIESEELYDEFPLSIWQTGSGTQTHMNVNEVIANVANELAGSPLGSKDPVHPNDHVNLSQSSNDTFPTAMHISICTLWHEELLPAVTYLRDHLKEKMEDFEDIVKIGRTHLMDAVPLTLGQEFSAYVAQMDQNIERLFVSLPHLYELAIGGTAVGTGLNAHDEFGLMMAKEIADETGMPFVTAPNKFAQLASKDPFVFASGALKTLACSLMKIANDIRLLASGPRAGFNELILPANEPGSSIMPGKVNPTQCEAMTQVCVQVMGNDSAITIAASQGQFQLNVFKPVILYNCYESTVLLSDTCRSFADHLVKGLVPNKEQIQKNVESSLMLVTALTPHIGYDKAAQVAQKAHEEGITLKEACVDLDFLSEEEFDKHVSPDEMV